MTRLLSLVACLMTVGSLAAAGQAADVAFSAKPTAVTQGQAVAISFAATSATDVEVAIVDGQGQVVRHLAAGVLGKNAPEPFKKDALAQTVAWDGKDDAGRDATGSFQVRVSLGATPKLDGYVGWDGQTLSGRVVGLAVGKDGELFVLLSDSFRGRSTMRVYDKAGKYLRTIMPYSADTPRERTASVGHLEVEGERLPIVFNGLGHTLAPLTSGMKMQNMAMHPKGYLVLASAVGTMAEHGPPRHLLAMHPQGGAPEGVNFVGPQLRKGTDRSMGGEGEASTDWFDHIAVSPDGQWAYLTTYTNSSRAKQSHGVFRVKWTDPQAGPLFLGKEQAGDDDESFNDPAGLAIDKAGKLYVCDRGNNRVKVYSPAGGLLGQFKVESPEQIAIHPQSGEIYILTHPRVMDKRKPTPTGLVKFAPFTKGEPKELARLDGRQISLMALDATGNAARLWVVIEAVLPADPDAKKAFPGPRTLLAPVAEQGGKFEVGPGINDVGGLDCPMHLAADPARKVAYVYEGGGMVNKVDLATGRKRPFVKGGDVALDANGNVYVMDGYNTGNTLSRFTPEGQPLPFPGADQRDSRVPPVANEGVPPSPTAKVKTLAANQIVVTRYRAYGPSLGFQGLAVRPNGDIYVAGSDNYGGPGNYGGRVCVYGPDGQLKQKNVIDGMGYGDCGLGVDAAGNMYVGVNLKPADQPFPAPFMGKVPAKGWTWWRFDRDGPREAPWVYTYYNSYLFHWGSVMKFGPEGGVFYGSHPYLLKPGSRYLESGAQPKPYDDLKNAPADAVALKSAYLGWDVKVAGMKWRYPGCGIVPSSGDGLMPDPGCVCYSSDLSADEYGRVFAPNVFRFSVEMLDSNGNQIARIGRYGNADSAGPASKRPAPEIAFAWPAFVSARGGKVFVSDAVNRRIAMVKFDHAAEETCSVK